MKNNSIFAGTTLNERLYLSGQMNAFDKAIKHDNRLVAYNILRQLKVDEPSIIQSVGHLKENLNFPNPWNFNNVNSNCLLNEYSSSLNYTSLKTISPLAPLSGKCDLEIIGNSNVVKKIQFEQLCAGPAVWNINGLKVAIPIWTKTFLGGKLRQIAVLDLKRQSFIIYKKKFRVLDLNTFENNLIKGHDSPLHKTKTVDFDLIKQPVQFILQLR